MGEGADADRRVRVAVGVRSWTSRKRPRDDGADNGVDADAELMRRALAPGRARPGVGRAAQPVGRVPWSCATARSSARARPSRPGGAARRGRGARGPPVTGPAAPPRTSPSSRAAHQGRTPPCADALVEAGVARVVVALEDPDPHVPGAGIAATARPRHRRSTSASAPTTRARSLAPVPRTTGAPGARFAVLKTAMSLDGRIAAARRLVAVDHRRRGPGRRPRAAGRLAGRRRRRGHRARRPARASPCATSSRPPSASRCACCSTRRGRVPGRRPAVRRRRSRPRSWSPPTPRPTPRSRRLARRRREGRRSPPAADRRRRRPRRRARAPRRRSACSRRWSRAAPTLHGALRRRRARRPAGRLRRADACSAPTGCPRSDLAGPRRIADAPRWRLRRRHARRRRRPPRLRAARRARRRTG